MFKFKSLMQSAARFIGAAMLVCGFTFVSCTQDDVDTGNKRTVQSVTPDEKIGSQIVKNTLGHDWDKVLDDDKAEDHMDALKTVYTVIDGEIVDEMKFGRHPLFDAGIYLEKENYQITADMVENKILSQELRRHYVKNPTTGLWEEKDTLIATTQDNIVYVPVHITTEEIEIGNTVVPFASDSVRNIRLVSVENVQAQTRSAGSTYVKAVHPTLYKAAIDVLEKNVEEPKSFEVPVQIMTNRYEIDVDDVAEYEVINQKHNPIDDETSELVADVVLTMKSGEVVNEHLSYIVNHKFTKRYGGKHYVAHFKYDNFAINPLYAAGTLEKVKTDGNWDIYGQTDTYRTDDANGVEEDLVTMWTDLYMEVGTYHHPVAGDIVWSIETPEVEQISTGITAVASDEEGWQKAELTDVISAKYLGRGQSLDAKADLYTKTKNRVDFELTNGELTVVENHIKGKIDVVETFSDGSTTTTTDNIDVEWWVKPITDWKAYEANSTQLTGEVVIKLVSSSEQSKGFWKFEQENREMTSEATLNASVQKNIWQSAVANKFKYVREGKTYTFDELKFEASNANGAYVTLAEKEDGLDTYKYGDKLTVKLDGVSVVSEAPGKIYITNATIIGYSAKDKDLKVTDNDVTASFTKVTKFSDNTEKEDKLSKTYPRSWTLLTEWSSHETDASQTTAQPTVKLEGSEPVSSEDGWSCVNETRFINSVVTLAGSKQNNSWRSVDPNSIKYSLDGFSVDFGKLNFTASSVNSGATLKSSTPTLDTYAYSGTIAVSFGSNTKNSSAPGSILVDKEKVVTGHEIRDARLVVNPDDVTANVNFVTLFNDGSEESVPDKVVLPRSRKTLSNWTATSCVFPFMTGAAGTTLTNSANKSNGYWSYTNQTRRIKTTAQLDGETNRDNEWETVDPNKLVYSREGVSHAFDEIEFDASYVDANTTLREQTATSATYDYTCEIKVVYGSDSQNMTAPGVITLAKERKVVGHEIRDAKKEITDTEVKTSLKWVTKYSDDTEEVEEDSKTFARDFVRLSDWASNEKNATQTTGAPTFALKSSTDQTSGYWSYTQELRQIQTIATLDASTQSNEWTSSDPNHIVYTREGISHDFGTDEFSVADGGASASLSSETATSSTYAYTSNISVTFGSNTKSGSAPGTITVAKERTITGKEVVDPELEVNDNNVSVRLTWVVSYSDGTQETEQISELFDRNWLRLTNWASVEANANQTTGAASVMLDKTEAKSKGYFSYDNETRTVTTEATLNASTQKNQWQSVDPNHIVFSRDGVSHDFGVLSFSVTENGASTSITSDNDVATVYGYTDNVQVVYGGNTKNDTAPGQITVNKPEKNLKWGKIKGTAATVAPTEDRYDWVYTLVARTEKGVIKFIVPKNGADITLDESMFEYNTASNINSAAYYQGSWKACEAKNQSTMMTWRAADGSKTYTYITYTDARQIGFQHGVNSVFTSDYSLSAESNGSVLKITRNSDGKTWLISMPVE